MPGGEGRDCFSCMQIDDWMIDLQKLMTKPFDQRGRHAIRYISFQWPPSYILYLYLFCFALLRLIHYHISLLFSPIPSSNTLQSSPCPLTWFSAREEFEVLARISIYKARMLAQDGLAMHVMVIVLHNPTSPISRTIQSTCAFLAASAMMQKSCAVAAGCLYSRLHPVPHPPTAVCPYAPRPG